MRVVCVYYAIQLATTHDGGGDVKEILTVVTRKGQITVPAEIRKALGLKEGDRVALSLAESGQPLATLRPARSVAEMTFGSVPARKRPEDFKELRQIFEEGVAEEVLDEGRRPAKPHDQ